MKKINLTGNVSYNEKGETLTTLFPELDATKVDNFFSNTIMKIIQEGKNSSYNEVLITILKTNELSMIEKFMSVFHLGNLASSFNEVLNNVKNKLEQISK